MATQILNLPLLSFSMTVGTNEDWVDSLGAYLDSSGNPLGFAGITLNFEMRPTAGSAYAPVIASTVATVAGLPVNGSVVVGGAGNNVPGLSVPLATMARVQPGIYAAELQAFGDGLTRTIGAYVVTVVQGVVR